MKKSSSKKEVDVKALEHTNMADNIIASGELVTEANSSNIKLINFSVNYHGKVLVNDSDLSLSMGQRYGLIGTQGAGKSSMLTAIGQRMVPIPEKLSIFHLDREVEASQTTALETVMADLASELEAVEDEYEELCMEDPENPRVDYLCERMEELDPDMAEVRASRILHGLGFTPEMQHTAVADFSGGWRMRVSLATALFISPDLLVLDDATAHLDVEAVVWLESYLKNYPRIILMVSHSQDFLNEVCTNIIHLDEGELTYYGGNYDTYVKTRKELEENQGKRYKWEQDQIAQMKDYIRRFGHGSSKLAKQAQSKEKKLARMQEKGLTKSVKTDKTLTLKFPSCGPLPPPVVAFSNVSFGYTPDKILYSGVNLAFDLDSRVCLLGLNGAGKSTLFKLMLGEYEPLEGSVKTHSHLKFGYFHQHLSESLDATLTPLEYMQSEYSEMSMEMARSQLGRFGITGDMQSRELYKLSDGQRALVVFSWLAAQKPHILVLDEPTNGLSVELIDSLAEALEEFEGGVLVISHDFRLIDRVAKEIWEVHDNQVTQFTGSILDYKKRLQKRLEENDSAF